MSAPSTALDAQFAPDHAKQSSLLQSQSAGSTSGLYGLSHALSTAPSAQLLLPGTPQCQEVSVCQLVSSGLHMT